jgi:hypothetical protein
MSLLLGFAVGWLVLNSPSPCPTVADIGWARRTDEALVMSIQASPACWVEPGLPQGTFSAWLKQQVGGGVEIRWQALPGCMLAPTGKTYPEYPLCVKASWWSTTEKYGAQVVLDVGIVRRDGRSRLAVPQPELLYVGPTRDGDDVDADSLTQLAQKIDEIRRWRAVRSAP